MTTTTETTVSMELCESELTALALALRVLRSASPVISKTLVNEVTMLEEKIKNATRELARKEFTSSHQS